MNRAKIDLFNTMHQHALLQARIVKLSKEKKLTDKRINE
jgi:hypothetical protein